MCIQAIYKISIIVNSNTQNTCSAVSVLLSTQIYENSDFMVSSNRINEPNSCIFFSQKDKKPKYLLQYFFSLTETLRKYSVIHLDRKCVKDYKIPDSNVTIEKGTTIIVPTYGLHHDEKFFPDPEKFDPTRFYRENKIGKSMVDMPYLPFGGGLRMCYGPKMAKMNAKVCMIPILQQYYVEIDDRHVGKEIKFIVGPVPIDGIRLKLRAKQTVQQINEDI